MAHMLRSSTSASRISSSFAIHHDNVDTSDSASEHSSSNTKSTKSGPYNSNLPMTTSKLLNQHVPLMSRTSTLTKINPPVNVDGNNISFLMGRKPQQAVQPGATLDVKAKPSVTQLKKSSLVPASVRWNAGHLEASQSVHNGPEGKNDKNDENVAVADLKKELEEAKKQIAGLNQQISLQNVTQQTMDHVIATPAPVNVQLNEDADTLLSRLSLRSKPKDSVDDAVFRGSDASPHIFDSCSAWGNPSNVMFGKAVSGNEIWDGGAVAAWNGTSAQGSTNGFDLRGGGFVPAQLTRAGSGGSLASGQCRGWNGSFAPGPPSSSGFTPPVSPFDFPQASNPATWQPRPSAATFMPTGTTDFTPWNSYTGQHMTQAAQQQYMPPVEPMNYRRLLDRNVSCNWKYIVDKIICSNDQQASIFLQQKLKVSSTELKYDLIESIIAQAYPLMINRFGNFLVQRCLEHGTPEQVSAIANVIRGKTLDLSMDAFGCHVVQKAFDVVPETYKAAMVHELLRQIPQTVVHRYACHVWQKLFELRWSDSPPQIMKCVNEALRGMWHEVALGETGSLVVQNIFENCLDEDKRPCIAEVLAHVDLVAHGQFGNWCIQHICEHGAPADKKRAVEHVLMHATEYSTDQFASKVVEKCLKVAGQDFLERYLEKVCEARPDRPRMPLIDIAGDQYGNYLVQFILLNADTVHREVVAQNIRKHMVSLRGSKFGSRVAMLCNNPAVSTRPGPPVPFVDRPYPQYNHPIGRTTMPGACR